MDDPTQASAEPDWLPDFEHVARTGQVVFIHAAAVDAGAPGQAARLDPSIVELARGADLVVTAVAEGRDAANSIAQLLLG